MVGIPTCRKTLLTPHFAIAGTTRLWGWCTIPGTEQILKHGVGTPAPWAQHPDTDAWELVNTKRHKPPRRNSNLERNPTVSAVWSDLRHDSLAQPVNLTSKADGKHLDFSSQKWDYRENLKANRISQCFQLTEELESVQGKECKVSSFHTFQPG